VVARWEGELNKAQLDAALAGQVDEDALPEVEVHVPAV
jgi:hypothetical protein